MGQKVSPHGFRVGIIKDWSSKWYADKNNFSDILIQDTEIRKELKHKLYDAGISRIVIERPNETKIRVDILVEKPGLVIGTKGSGTKAIKELLEKKTSKTIDLNIVEARVPELDAQLLAERIAKDLERRTAFRRAMKTAMGSAVKAGAKGVKIFVSGRLNGAEIARAEKYNEGSVPLHTLRADIDYGFTEAETTYGKLGVKVWINKGEILESGLKRQIPEKRRDDDDQKRRRTSGGGESRRGGRTGGAGGRPGGKGRRVSSRRDSRADLTRQQNPRMRINNAVGGDAHIAPSGKSAASAKPASETKPTADAPAKPDAEPAGDVGGSDSGAHIAPPDAHIAPKNNAPAPAPQNNADGGVGGDAHIAPPDAHIAPKNDTPPDTQSATPEHNNKEKQ